MLSGWAWDWVLISLQLQHVGYCHDMEQKFQVQPWKQTNKHKKMVLSYLHFRYLKKVCLVQPLSSFVFVPIYRVWHILVSISSQNIKGCKLENHAFKGSIFSGAYDGFRHFRETLLRCFFLMKPGMHRDAKLFTNHFWCFGIQTSTASISIESRSKSEWNSRWENLGHLRPAFHVEFLSQGMYMDVSAGKT